MSSNYTIIYNSTLDDDNLSIQEQSILIALNSYFNKEKGYAYPSYAQLKRRSKISDNRTLIKGINSIIEKGYIKKETVKGRGCRYFILKESGEVHQVENYTTCKNTPTPSGKLREDIVENYTTTNTNINTNINNNIYKKEKDTNLDKIINSYSDDEELKDTIRDFLKMRKAIKKPMTERALKIMLKKLNGFSDNAETQIKILEQSIVNSWQGIFQLKESDVSRNVKINNNKLEEWG